MTDQAQDAARRAERLHRESLVWDNTVPWFHESVDEEALPRFRRSGVDVFSLTVASDKDNAASALHKIARIRRMIAADPTLVPAFSVEDVRRAKREGRLAIVLHFQGTNPFEGDPGLVGLFYDLGVRHALLAYNTRNLVADGCAEAADAGLSRAGALIVQEMNRVGMIVDGSHSGHRSTMEAIELCSGPFVFSHSNAFAVFPHFRNIKDDQIRACARTGGVVGVNGVGVFLAEDEADATVEHMVEHIHYIAQLVGPAHVGVASDFVGNIRANAALLNPVAWPPNAGRPLPAVPQRFIPPEDFPRLTEGLVRRGYSDAEIRGILGENWARVAQQVWK